MEMIYLVVGDTWTGTICSTTVEGIYKSIDGANKRIQELIPYEKKRAVRYNSGFSPSEEEVEEALKDKGIKYKFLTYPDGQTGFTIEDEVNDITTFLNIVERVLED